MTERSRHEEQHNETRLHHLTPADPGDGTTQQQGMRTYYVSVQAHVLDRNTGLIDEIIDFAFGTLGARHLDVRVCPYEL